MGSTWTVFLRETFRKYIYWIVKFFAFIDNIKIILHLLLRQIYRIEGLLFFIIILIVFDWTWNSRTFWILPWIWMSQVFLQNRIWILTIWLLIHLKLILFQLDIIFLVFKIQIRIQIFRIRLVERHLVVSFETSKLIKIILNLFILKFF